MTEERQAARDKYAPELESTARFGDWSIEKYKMNKGVVIYHWKCGFWSTTFFADKKNICWQCKVYNVPDEVEALVKLYNFDLMSNPEWNASA